MEIFLCSENKFCINKILALPAGIFFYLQGKSLFLFSLNYGIPLFISISFNILS